MYLKAIELVGFKSFAERVRLDFAEGLTTIVGANGSGKSNIVDAVLWVLGEQNARNLRGAKMEEIIFSGSEKRRAVGMAEVTLIIDNQDHTLPIDYEELSVMRRLFRDGTSEYYINQQQCRLKDIVELFLDTGVGKGSFSIIGQGQIDEILSYKPIERRVVLEEVAGIAKFKFRKREAQLKLDRLQERLQRVDDILSEIDRQIGPLNRQAIQAEKYLLLKEELRKFELTFLAQEHRRMSKERVELLHQSNVSKEAYAASQARTAVESAILEKMKLEQIRTEQQIEAQNQQSNQLRAQMEEYRIEQKILEERLKNDRTLLEQYSSEEQIEIGKQQEISNSLERLKTEQQTLSERKSTLQKEIESLRISNRLLLQEEEAGKQQETALQERLNVNNQSQHRLTGKIEGLQREEETLQKNFETLQKSQQRLQKQVEEKESQEAKLNQRLQDSLSEVQQLEKNLQKAQQAWEQVQKDQRQQQENLQQVQTTLQMNSNRLSVLTELADQMDGYHKGAKAVILGKKSGNPAFQGVHDTIAGLVRVDQAYETAIEMILGNNLQNIVVDEPVDAEKAIEWLKQQRSGRATFYPLSTVRGKRDESLWARVEGKPGVIALGSDLARSEAQYRPIIENLLGNVLVMETLPLANQIARELNHRYRIVTLTGDLIFPGGAITGGSIYQKAISLLGREREIEELAIAIQQQTQQVAEQQEQFQAQRKENELLAQAMQEEQIEHTNRSKQRQQMQVSYQLLQAELESDKTLAQRQEAELTQQRALQRALQQQTEESEQQGQSLRAEAEELRKALETCRKQSQSAKQKALQEQLQQQELAFALAEQRFQDAALLIQQQENRIQQTLQEALVKKERFDETTARIDLTQNQLSQNLQTYRTVAEQQKLTESKYETIKEQRENFRTSMNEQDERIFQARKAEDHHREQAYYHSSSLAKLESEYQYLLEKIQNDYNFTPEQLPEQPLVEVDDAAELQKHCSQLRNKIREMGMVNLGAIEEKNRLQERKTYLTEQGEDIRLSCQGIWKVLGEIDKDMEQRFVEAFHQVNHHFMQVFTQLFQGGNASLQLTDPKDLLNTGLDIIAQLPGKKAGNLSLLSGGERALTAVALLIAIIQVKKPPFCLLDEIETSLDEGNVKRVAKILRDCSTDTQIISVSHRKGMMEESDALIGVTMQSPGVSTVISVRFGEREKQEEEH